MEEKIEIQEEYRKSFPILVILFRNILLILICAVIFLGVGTLYAYKTKQRVYTTTIRVDIRLSLSTDKGAEIDQRNDITLSKMYLPVIVSIYKSQKVVDQTIEESQGKYKAGDISISSIQASYGESSLIFQIGYSDLDETASREKLIAVMTATNTVLHEYPPLSGSTITLVPTQRDYTTTSTRGIMSVALTGLLIGIVLGVVIAILRYLLDNKIKDVKELEDITKVPLLAFIEKQ